MALSVKSYYEREGVTKPEIRRLSIDQGLSTNFSVFSERVCQLYGGIKNVDLFWKDEEGDLVAFSSDEELVEALGNMQDDVFRVYIRGRGGRSDEGAGDGVLHPGVVCDGCDGQIRGRRFKCVTCADYDLCAVCEEKGTHTQHDMMLIRVPGNFVPPFWFGRRGSRHHRGPWGGPPPFQCPPWLRKMWAGWEGGRPDAEGEASTSTGEAGAEAAPPPYWDRKQCKRMWHHYCKGTFDKKEKDEQNSAESENAAEPNAAEQEAPNANDYLRSVGETIAAILDPLGIDVAVDVEHGGERQRCGADTNKPKIPEAEPKTESDSKGKSKKSKPAAEQVPTAPSSAEESGDTEMKDANAETGEQGGVPMEVSKSAKQTESSDEDWTFLNSKDGSPRSGGATASPSSSASGSDKVTGDALYPPLPQPEPHPDPRVAKALVQLKAMGFSDEGGWLTRLLEAKDANIGHVLDIIIGKKSQ